MSGEETWAEYSLNDARAKAAANPDNKLDQEILDKAEKFAEQQALFDDFRDAIVALEEARLSGADLTPFHARYAETRDALEASGAVGRGPVDKPTLPTRSPSDYHLHAEIGTDAYVNAVYEAGVAFGRWQEKPAASDRQQAKERANQIALTEGRNKDTDTQLNPQIRAAINLDQPGTDVADIVEIGRAISRVRRLADPVVRAASALTAATAAMYHTNDPADRDVARGLALRAAHDLNAALDTTKPVANRGLVGTFHHTPDSNGIRSTR